MKIVESSGAEKANRVVQNAIRVEDHEALYDYLTAIAQCVFVHANCQVTIGGRVVTVAVPGATMADIDYLKAIWKVYWIPTTNPDVPQETE